MLTIAPRGQPNSHIASSSNRFAVYGWAVIFAVFGSLAVWSVFAPFDGAVIASGSVSAPKGQLEIQHLDGGIVAGIYVAEADDVVAGQLLLSFDKTEINAEIEAIQTRLLAVTAAETRLLSERDGASQSEVPPASPILPDSAAYRDAMETQTDIRNARRANVVAQTEILVQQEKQLREQLAGTRDEISRKSEQEHLLTDELYRYEELASKGNISVVRVLALKRELSRVQSEREVLSTRLATLGAQLSETSTKRAAVSDQFELSVLSELQDVQGEIDQLRGQARILQARLERMDVAAPRSGRVLGINAHTIGATVFASQPIMTIVPADEPLVVNLKVSVSDIDQVSTGQPVMLRFTAFSQQTTPTIQGSVLRVSADALRSEGTGGAFYEVVVEFDQADLRNSRLGLVAGMPVEGAIRTSRRSVASYLTKPLTDALARSFRE